MVFNASRFAFKALRIAHPRRAFSRRVAARTTDSAVSCRRSIEIRNEQTDIDVNKAILMMQAADIMDLLKVSGYKLSVVLCNDDMMKAYHKECLETYESTDIISLRTQKFSAPEVFSSKWQVSKNLGRIIICPAFVDRIHLQEKQESECGDYLLDEEDAGVSRAMSAVSHTRDRIPLLLIHGMLHLLGHDHEEINDWKFMTSREDEIIKAFTGLPSWTLRDASVSEK